MLVHWYIYWEKKWIESKRLSLYLFKYIWKRKKQSSFSFIIFMWAYFDFDIFSKKLFWLSLLYHRNGTLPKKNCFGDVVCLHKFRILIQVFRSWAVKKVSIFKYCSSPFRMTGVSHVRGHSLLCSISFCLRKAHTKCSKANQKWGRHMHRSKGSIQYWSPEKAIFLPSCPILSKCCLDYVGLWRHEFDWGKDPCLVFFFFLNGNQKKVILLHVISIVAVLTCSLS